MFLVMKYRLNLTLLHILMVFCMTSCYKDNYEGPNANFHGKLEHYQTGEPFYSEQPNGFQIRFTELSWGPNVTSQTLYGKYDGSFNWDHLFGYNGAKYDDSPYEKATYKLEPYDGAFILDDENKEKIIEVGPGESVEVNFKVIPFISIRDFEYELNGNELTVKFKMNREAYPSTPINKAGVLVSSLTEYLSYQSVGGYEGKYSIIRDNSYYSSYSDGTLMTEKVTLDSGKTYWMRVGALLDGKDRWNFTQIVEITVP